MDLKLKELEKKISGINFRSEDKATTDTRREIYNDVVSIAKPASDRPPDIPPPLVFYAIRNIMYPTFIVGQIPDLLNLLTMVDTFRQFAGKKSGEALTWNQYFSQESNHQDVRLLTGNEIGRLEHYQARNELQRRKYIILLHNLCFVYIHYLWTAPESCLLAIRLNDFFPGSVEGFSGPSSFLFHDDLSEDEKRSFAELKDQCSASMKTILDWESEREELGRQQGKSMDELNVSFSEDFRATFPPPIPHHELLVVLEKYVKSVEDMVQKLEGWFPSPDMLGTT